MIDTGRFRALFTDTSAPDLSELDYAEARTERSATSGMADLVVGLGLRLALVVQFYTWARANAEPVSDPFDWRDWLNPAPGLELAVEVWTLGRIDPALMAFALLATATLCALSFGLGLFTRITAVFVSLGVIWHMAVIAPEAWTHTLGYFAIALALVLRGAGGASMDWILSRLARFG